VGELSAGESCREHFGFPFEWEMMEMWLLLGEWFYGSREEPHYFMYIRSAQGSEAASSYGEILQGKEWLRSRSPKMQYVNEVLFLCMWQ
jgi:hypothetical protein